MTGMMRFTQGSWMKVLWASLMLALLTLAGGVRAEADDPGQFVDQVTRQVWQALEENRERFKADHQALKQFVEEQVEPWLATEKMARYVLGRHWRTATDEQKQRFIEAFRDMLLRSYANSILGLEIQDMHVDKVVPARRGRYQVEQTVRRGNGQEAKVVYRVYRDRKTGQWKIYDVVVENVSLLMNYRKVFDSELQKKGIDQVIAEMEEKNRAFLEETTAEEGTPAETGAAAGESAQ